MLESDFNKIYLVFTPLRVGDLVYDMVCGNHGDPVGDMGTYVNQLQVRKWRNLNSLHNLLPLFHFLSIKVLYYRVC